MANGQFDINSQLRQNTLGRHVKKHFIYLQLNYKL